MADLRAQILAIQSDASLSESEKAIKRQQLLTKSFFAKQEAAQKKKDAEDNYVGPSKKKGAANGRGGKEDDDELIGENLKCVICMNVCCMPVTAACQHNFCLSCLTKWTQKGKKTCVLCRAPFSRDFISNPRINTTIVALIRASQRGGKNLGASEAIQLSLQEREKRRLALNAARPDEAFVTKRAQKTGLANAASGKLKVTCPTDMFGPIGPQYDSERKRGLLVGDSWPNRLVCRQYGAHFPHVAGIAGQGDRGAQSVVLSGGYIDDHDQGHWFVYTGSGGRDLSGNKRTASAQGFDQEFSHYNASLQVSCKLGLPLRVVRSHKEKRSNFAPGEKDANGQVIPCVRYDGIYRVEKCWRKAGQDGFLVCRYLMVRCDNDPAPWDTGEEGDRPGSEKSRFRVEELDCQYDLSDPLNAASHSSSSMKLPKGIVDYCERDMSVAPAWDWSEEEERWGWTCKPPLSGRLLGQEEGKTKSRLSDAEILVRDFGCDCSAIRVPKKAAKPERHVLKDPVSAPCGHNFCRTCLTDLYEGMGDEVNRTASSGRSLRKKKVVKPCPVCKKDISECVNNMKVNHELAAVIEKLKRKVEESGTKVPVGGAGKAKEAGEGAEAKAGKRQRGASAAGTGGGGGKKEGDGMIKKLDALLEEFPGADRELVETLLRDQDGDVKDVACMLRMMQATTTGKAKKKRKT